MYTISALYLNVSTFKLDIQHCSTDTFSRNDNCIWVCSTYKATAWAQQIWISIHKLILGQLYSFKTTGLDWWIHCFYGMF